MPGTYDPERNGRDKTARKQALLSRANSSTADFRTWTEYFSQKKSAVVSTVVTTGTASVKHAALHTFAKVAVYTVGYGLGGPLGAMGTYIAELVGGGYFWSLLSGDAQKALEDYGAGVIDDWVKFGGEETGKLIYESVTTSPAPTHLSTSNSTIQTETTALCAAIGVLSALITQSEELRTNPVVYCDDAYAQARIIKRIEQEMVNVKAAVDTVKTKLDSLKTFVDTSLTSDVSVRKTQIDALVENTVKAAGAPHFVDTYWSYVSNPNPLYRLSHCSKTHCFGPGQTGLD